MRKERINEIWGVFFLLLGLFTLASLLSFEPKDIPFYTSHPFAPIQNYTGVIGAYAAFGLVITFGISAYLIPMLFLLWSGCFFLQKVPERKVFKFLGLAIALFSTATLVAISVAAEARFDEGGAIGYLAGSHLLKYFGPVGSYIVAGSCLLLSLLLATDFLIYPVVKKIFQKGRATIHFSAEKISEIKEEISDLTHAFKPASAAAKSAPAAKAAKAPAAAKEKEPPAPKLPPIEMKVKRYQPDVPEEDAQAEDKSKKSKEKDIEAPAAKKQQPAAPLSAPAAALPAAPSKPKEESENRHEGVVGSKAAAEYKFPSIELLKRPSAGQAKNDDLQGNSRLLEETLMRFGIEVKVVEVEQGPVITRYELLPAPGVKVNSITALQDDLALALKARSIRLIVPIPGKSAVGVEVPNLVSSVVSLRELIDSAHFRAKKAELPLVLGKDTSGKTLIADLSVMPHILIAGTTGSGKTVCVNSIITGLLYNSTPEQLKLVMIDPKMVELAVYNKIPHMLTPVVTNVKKAAHTLNWVVNEMENRYKLLATCGVRNIQTFNARPMSEEALQAIQGKEESENVIPAKLPYIVVIIDELADLMLTAADKVEPAIARLAQLARAVGIHLILATQRPSVDVITGVIKANFPARISFKVASKVDSRTVLDANGADKLLGRGDMLFMKPGDEKPTRGQAPLVVDEEINGVVDFWSNQAKPEYHPEIATAQEGKSSLEGGGEKDELFDEAVAVVLETGQASTSNLQRRLRLGYTRAARIIDQMEAEGIIGPTQGAKPREILIAQHQPAAVAHPSAESESA
ncbi:MAG TPA: DNA translocase FtsK 4TM domain-containing protein [Verrucomicrobiae bacterium]|jgi:S-DNA-T family DNA segregation ATPase FtsK/SpoIIIE|nr:DNA translocase FtsK 4TM domain-containing protein [Verrucomicrobiae bacterium]